MDVIASPAAHAAALWSGLLLLLMLVLSFLVTRQRQKFGVVLGDGDIEAVALAMRAFGNASEYIPAAIGALTLLAVVGSRAIIIHGLGAMLLIGRVAHAVGLSTNAGLSTGRSFGMVLTWLGLLLCAGLLLFYSAP